MPKLPNYADSIMGVQKTSCCARRDFPQHSNFTYAKTLHAQRPIGSALCHLLEDDDEVPDVKVEAKHESNKVTE